MATFEGNALVVNEHLVLSSLVLAGGFYYQPGVGIVPIPNGVYHAGQFAVSAVISLRQYAMMATTPEVRDALNAAAEDLATKLEAPIQGFQKLLGEKIARTIAAAG
jgi:hypothetical protein